MIGALNPSYRAADKARRLLLSSFIHYSQAIDPPQRMSYLNAVNAGRMWSGNSDDWAITACHMLEQMGYKSEFARGWAPLPTGGRTACSFCIINGFAILPHQVSVVRIEQLEELGYHVSRSDLFHDIDITIAP